MDFLFYSIIVVSRFKHIEKQMAESESKRKENMYKFAI